MDELDADEDGNALEEDAADVAARRRAAAKAREEAELKRRSQVRPAKYPLQFIWRGLR